MINVDPLKYRSTSMCVRMFVLLHAKLEVVCVFSLCMLSHFLVPAFSVMNLLQPTSTVHLILYRCFGL